MDDPTYKKWDIRLKFIAPLLTATLAIAGFWFSISQFNREQSAQRERQIKSLIQSARIEFNRKMWEKRLEAYMNFTRVVGRIAAEGQSRKELEANSKEFSKLYWGEMIYFEDDEVRAASKALRAEIKHYMDNGAKDNKQLRQVAEHLIQTCRESSNRNYPSG